MSQRIVTTGEPVVLLDGGSGSTIIPIPTPLTRLNYFDGKFLRAADLAAEQEYHRQLVFHANRAGGSGVVHGLSLSRGPGDSLLLGAGLAVDPLGRLLLLPEDHRVGIADLLGASRRRPRRLERRPGFAAFGECEVVEETPAATATAGRELYLLVLAHAEALCGEEDVYGKLCESRCATSADRPSRVEGVVLRAIPLPLSTPLATSRAVPLDRRHLRSLVASAVFADERADGGSLISGAGLREHAWCLGAAAEGGAVVPLGVLARAGGTTLFLDQWTARRERMEAPARRYWAGRMAMRPWPVFLAQVLQFQCQLSDLLAGQVGEPGTDDDPCRDNREVIGRVKGYLDEVANRYTAFVGTAADRAAFELPGGASRMADVRRAMQLQLKPGFTGPRQRVLIAGGIVELPPAGYLPVLAGSAVSVNTQVRRLLGDGVNLRFCVVRPDVVPHALEEAQHMDRISLLQGLDDPAQRPDVDVLVPDGEIEAAGTAPALIGWETAVHAAPIRAFLQAVLFATQEKATAANKKMQEAVRDLVLQGAARTERTASGGAAFHFAGASGVEADVPVYGKGEIPTANPAGFGNVVSKALGDAPAAVTLDKVVALDEISRIRDAGLRARTAAAAVRAMAAGADTADVVVTARSRARRPAATGAAEAPEAGAIRGHVPEIVVVGERPIAAIWCTAQFERDPWTLAEGERTGCSARLTFGRAAAGVGELADLRVNAATLTVESVTADQVSGRLTGDAVVQVVGGDTGGKARAIPLNLRVMLGRVSTAAGMRVVVGFGAGPRALTVGFIADIGGSPTEVQVAVHAGVGGQAMTFTNAIALPAAQPLARLVRNDGVLGAVHPLRQASTAALGVLDAVLAQVDPDFDTVASRLLFPPPPVQADALTVRATHDWVLFHRRRTRRCGEEPVAVAPPTVKRYQVYHARVKSVAEARQVRARLEERPDAETIRVGGFIEARTPARGSPLRGPRLVPVDIVEFAAGSAVLATPAAAIAQDWAAVPVGQAVVFASLAAHGADAAEEALGRPRLATLLGALAERVKVSAAQLDVTDEVAPEYRTEGTDGTIVIVTMDPPKALQCHDTYLVSTRDYLLKFVDLLKMGTAVKDALTQVEAVELAKVEFEPGTATFGGDKGAAARLRWTKAGQDLGLPGAGKAPQDGVVTALGTSTAGEIDTWTAQGDAVMKLLGATTPARLFLGAAPMPGACPALTVLLPPPD